MTPRCSTDVEGRANDEVCTVVVVAVAVVVARAVTIVIPCLLLKLAPLQHRCQGVLRISIIIIPHIGYNRMSRITH